MAGGVYLVGNERSKFAVSLQRRWRWGLPWHPPRGGWPFGPVIIWWSL